MTSSGAKSPEQIEGYEYDWLATDMNGLVALFSTAGFGHAPHEFLQDTDAHAAAIEALLASPATTDARFAPELSAELVNTWKSAAERGVFAFDCDAPNDLYRIAAAPVAPVRVDSLPPSVAEVASRIRLPIRFDAEETVTTEMLCRNG